MLRLLASLFLAAVTLLPPSANAQTADFVPKPDTYLCPNAAGPGSIDCFLNAVEHLYTMCRQVKSIEIIEFGYEKSDEGVNGAKSEYCVDKHKGSMARPYQAALKEATPHRSASETIRGLHDQWLAALRELKWKPGESDDDYKARISRPYDQFKERAQAVRLALAESLATRTASAATTKGSAAKPATKAATKPPTKVAAKSPTTVATQSSSTEAAKGAAN